MLDFLSLVKNRVFWIVMLMVASAVGAGYYTLSRSVEQLQSRNSALTVELQECRQRAQIAADAYAANEATFNRAIADQNAKIVELRAAGVAQQQRVDGAVAQLNKLQAQRDALIKQLRDTPVDKLGCEASIGLLAQSARTLGWPKGSAP